jgi:hypothetical protein
MPNVSIRTVEPHVGALGWSTKAIVFPLAVGEAAKAQRATPIGDLEWGLAAVEVQWQAVAVPIGDHALRIVDSAASKADLVVVFVQPVTCAEVILVHQVTMALGAGKLVAH